MAQSVPPTRKVVLVVKDEPLLMMLAVDAVEDAGFLAIEARNADEAIGIIERRSDIVAIFTEIDMPGSINGLKLAAVVRDRWPPVQIIITSGHMNPSSDQIPHGAMFIPKPYDIGLFGQQLHRLMGEL